MMRRTTPWLAFGLAAAAAAPLLLSASPARAVGSQVGDLVTGGTAKGDISTEAGETDRVTVDLVAGEPIDVTFTAGFHSTFVCTDPDGGSVDLGATGDRIKVKRFVTPKTGQYEFTISAADGTQGFWSLTVKPAWEKKLAVAGAGDGDLGVTMPAGGAFTAKIKSTSTPSLGSITGPDQQTVLGTVAGRRSLLKVPRTTATLGGTYVLSMDVADDAAAWSGKVVRTLPKWKATKLDLTNGLTPISFEKDGVGQIFGNRCGSCHDWARSYAGVRSAARESLGRIRTGNMPQGSSRLPNDQIDLIAAWIQTGSNR